MAPRDFFRQPDVYTGADRHEAARPREEEGENELDDPEETPTNGDPKNAEEPGFWEARNERVKSPEFQAELAKELAELRGQLKEAGDASLDFFYKGLIKKVLAGTVSDEIRSVFSGKYDMVRSTTRTAKRIGGAGKLGLRAVGKIAQATGKATKIGTRYLIGK